MPIPSAYSANSVSSDQQSPFQKALSSLVRDWLVWFVHEVAIYLNARHMRSSADCQLCVYVQSVDTALPVYPIRP